MRAPAYIEAGYCVDYIRDDSAKMRWGGGGTFLWPGIELVKIYSTMPRLGYSERTKRLAFLSVKGAYWRNISLAKAKGFTESLKFFSAGFRYFRDFPSFWFIDIPLLLAPGFIFKALFWFYKIPIVSNLLRTPSRRFGLV